MHRLVLPLLAVHAAAQGPDDFVAWAATAAHHLPDPTATSAAEADTALAFLAPLVGDRRVVALGESAPTAEGRRFRIGLLRHLAARGFRHIGIALGRADGRAVDRFFASGERAHLDRVAAFAAARAGTAAGEWAAAERHFFEEAAAIADDGAGPLQWFGYDIDPVTDGLYEDVGAALEPLAEDPIVAEVSRRLVPPPRETPPEEVRRLVKLATYLDRVRADAAAALGDERLEWLDEELAALTASVRFRAATSTQAGDDELLEAFARRERWMARSIARELAQRGDVKVVLLGSNLRFARAPGALWLGAADGPRHRPWPSLGSLVEAELRPFTLWQCDPDSDDEVTAALRRVGRRFVLPLASADPRSRWLDEERRITLLGAPAGGILRSQADALVLLPAR